MDFVSYAIGKASGGEPTPVEPDLVDLSVTSNGTYTHEDHDGYDEVTVNVPNTYAAGDEGKVVSSGALVSQTSITKTSNGTYDTTLNNEVVVNVPSTPAPTGTISITTNGITDVTNYASADVNVSGSAPDNYISITNWTSSYNQRPKSAYVNSKYFSFYNQYSEGTSGVSEDNKQFTMMQSVTFNTTKVTVIPSQAFYNCGQLGADATQANPYNNFQLHEGITTIGEDAFRGCTSMGEYWPELPSTIEIIGKQAFYGLSSFGKYLDILPSSLEKISDSAFNGCSSLGRYGNNSGQLTLPSSLDTVNIQAFYGCSRLANVYFAGTPTTVSSNVFSNCTRLTDMYVPWSEGDVANAPWGATNATIHYDYTPQP